MNKLTAQLGYFYGIIDGWIWLNKPDEKEFMTKDIWYYRM